MELKSFFQASFASKRIAFYLNLLGLTLAFTIFYILMSEVKWVNSFDSYHKDADRVYKIHSNLFSEDESKMSPSLNVFWINKLMEYSPDVEHSVLITQTRGGKNAIAPADSTIGTEMIDADFCYVTNDIANVFTFDMIEGNSESISDPSNALIPLSLAKKLYGDKGNYIGRTFGSGNWFLNVGGVYKDFPTNSIVKNMVYQSMDESIYNKYLSEESEWNHFCCVRLRKGANHQKVYENFLYDNRDVFNYLEEDKLNEFLKKKYISLIPLHEIYFLPKAMGGWEGSYYANTLFFVLACLFILIAAINFMNFSMAIVPYHIKSINMKKILGASSLSLRLSLLTEVFLTIVTAIILALILLNILITGGYLTSYIKSDIAFSENIILLVYMGISAILVTLFSGLYPAYYMTSHKPALIINGSFALSQTGRTFRKILIGIQFTFSLITIIIVLLMSSQSYYIRNSSVGYARDSILYVQADQEFVIEYYDAFMSELRSNPYIINASWSQYALGETDNSMAWGREYEEQLAYFLVYPVEPDFLHTVGIKVSEGRDFRQEDRSGEKGVYIFNETAKKKYNLKLNTHIGNGEIIGFIPDIKSGTFKKEIAPLAFYIWGKNWGVRVHDYKCVIRANAPDNIPKIRQFVESTYEKLSSKQSTMLKFYTKEDIAKIAYVDEDKQILMALVGCLIFLFIPIIGVFGLVLFETQAKRKEIGIRKVYGASTNNILLMFNKHYLNTLIICFVIAAPISYYLYTIWVENFAYQIPTQWWLFAVAFLIVAIVVCGTVTIQSWRAARELPVNVLHK